ncbi:Ribonuclease VapC [Rubrivivax sp. A210]|uniref:type II toxin-antitoxin system VapC family toxin n=1 Tax=Rubrivivax sp. A210 TaxID=2772301 RepID=UPI001918F7BF|nr:type II toxin-antitoxin system VapC family toxin [Rubrivivax sp. A210]CAD5374204.1 Ribonuclease VapC [Rubrivivax sp. A210]
MHAKDAAQRMLYLAEPAPAWTERPPVVVDCSVLSAVLWAEPAAAQARAQLQDRSLHAPGLLRYELANVARNKVRSGVPAAVARAALEAFAEQKLVLHDIDPARLFDVAQRLSLSAYDAAYLCLAAELRAPLLTFDQRLADAARRHLAAPD